MTHTEHNLAVALTLAEQGFFVFPCQGKGERRKVPCPGVAWRSASTTDPRVIRMWWHRWPDAVPALDLARCGLLGFDCDCNAGHRGLDWAEQHIGKGILDCAPGSDTPSGGRHSVFLNKKDKPFGNGRGGLPSKEVFLGDVKGAGGYIIAPGARFAEGGYYAPRGDLRDALPLPETLLRYLTGEQPAAAIEVPPEPVSEARIESWGEAALAGMAADLANTPEGDRNNTASRLAFRAGRMVAGGVLARGEARAALTLAATQAGLPAKEAAQTVARGIGDGIRKGPPITGPVDDTPSVTIDAKVLGRQAEEEGETPPEAEGGVAPQPASITDSLSLDDWSQPAGLLGEMADWIMLTSRRPNRPLAVAAAVATLSTVCGRHLYGPTGTALNLYIVMLAGTAIGKDRPLAAPRILLEAAGYPQLAQTAKAFSVSALEQRMLDYPCHLAVADEIGSSLLTRLSQNKYRPPHEVGMRSSILELWSRVQGKGPFDTTRHARQPGVKEQPTHSVPSPSLSMLGASTHEEFYNMLSGASIRDGFLNRFLLCHAGARGATQEVPVAVLAVPTEISEGLRAIVPDIPGSLAEGGGNLAALAGVFHLDAPLDSVAHRVPWADESVLTTAAAFEAAMLALCDGNAEEAPLLGRVFEYAVRLATLHAVSRVGLRHRASVGHVDWSWGVAWAKQSAQAMIRDAKLYMADSEAQAVARAIRRSLDGKGRVRKSVLLRALDNKYTVRDFDSILKSMIEDGRVQTGAEKTGGRTATWYHWVG